MWSYRLLDAACSARPLALLNYGAMPPLQAAALLCTSGRGGAYRLFEEPKRDPGIHSGRGGATAGGLARLQPAAALAYFPRAYRK